MLKQFFTTLLLAAVLPIQAQDIVTNPSRLKARPFDMKEVRLKKSIFTKTSLPNDRYLKNFPTQRLLYNFYANAGMKPKSQPLGGWESPDCELRGHFTGHFLSALSLDYSSTGDPALKLKADTMVQALAKVQRRLGKSGYLSAFPESFFDRLEKGQNVWAPYYTLHKILAGLLDCYMYLDNQTAFEVAKKMGLWVYNRNKDFSYDKMQRILRTEFGGIGESLWILYDLTKDSRYRDAAMKFRDDKVLQPLYHHRDSLTGLHSNTQLPKLLAQARAYEVEGDWHDRDMVDYAWHEIVANRSYATGGNSNYEYFRSPAGVLADYTGPNDHENCVTHNMLKLTSHLFCWNPRVEYADYYERALMNGVLGTQHPKVAGTAQYYVSQRPGSFREFCDPDWSYVCCSGTGIESFAKFNNNIYFHDDSTLWVNQYIASTLDWRERGIKLDMETGYPRFDDIHFTLTLDHPQRLSIKFRVPYWADRGATVTVNGEQLDVVGEAASYLTLCREWHSGDKVDLVIPRGFHLWHFPDRPNRVAILYGPVVMCAGLGTTQMSKDAQWGMGGESDREHRCGAVVDVPVIVSDSDNWLSAFKLHQGHRLTFDAKGISQPTDITLTPFYDMWGQRYTLYFDVYNTQEWKAFCDRYRTFPEGVVDSIDFGDKVSTYDHNLQAYYLKSGVTEGRTWVQSPSDFRFDLRVPSDGKPCKLRVTYYGDESNTRFAMDIDGKPFSVQAPKPHQGFFTETYDLPADLLTGRQRISIGFSVPRDRGVQVGETTTRKEYRYITPAVYGAEIVR